MTSIKRWTVTAHLSVEALGQVVTSFDIYEDEDPHRAGEKRYTIGPDGRQILWEEHPGVDELLLAWAWFEAGAGLINGWIKAERTGVTWYVDPKRVTAVSFSVVQVSPWIYPNPVEEPAVMDQEAP